MGGNWRRFKLDISKSAGLNLEVKFKPARVNLAKFSVLAAV